MTSTSGIDDPGNRPSRRKQKSPRKNSSFCENDRFGYPENAMSDEKIDDATSNVIMLPDSESEMDHVSQGSLPYPVCVIPNVNNADTENSSFYSNILDSNGLSATTSLNRINPIPGLSMTQSSQSNVLEIVPIDDNDSIENCSTEEYKSKPGQTEEHIPPLSELDMPNASGQPASITCNECGRKFAKRHQLEVHKLMGHDVKQKFRCPHCRLFFPFKSVLASHVKSAHSGQLLQQLEGKKNNTRFSLDKTFNSCFGEHKTVYMYKEAHGKPLLEGKYIVVKENEAITCFNCDFEIKTVEKMQTHYADDHSDWKLVVICPNCMRECHTLKKVEHHLRSKKCMRLTALCCKPCGISFDSPVACSIHNKKVHRGKYNCAACGLNFKQRFFLDRHREKFHHDGSTMKSSHLTPHIQNRRRGNNRKLTLKHPCMFCRRGFNSTTNLKAHFLNQHCERDNKKAEIYTCQKCKMQFNSNTEKQRHIYSDHRTFVCGVCGKAFPTKYKLNKHENGHTDSKLKCTLCEDNRRTYATEFYLKQHVKRVHIEHYSRIYGWEVKARTYDCEVCGKKSLSIGDHRKHSRVHTNERPFPCPHCPSAFKQSRHVKEHMMYKHKKEYEEEFGEIIYKHCCDECDKKFLAKGALNKHKRAHARQKVLEQCRTSSSDASSSKVDMTSSKKDEMSHEEILNLVTYMDEKSPSTARNKAKRKETGLPVKNRRNSRKWRNEEKKLKSNSNDLETGSNEMESTTPNSYNGPVLETVEIIDVFRC